MNRVFGAGFLYAPPHAWAVLDDRLGSTELQPLKSPDPQRIAIAAKSKAEARVWVSSLMKLQMLLLDIESYNLVQRSLERPEDIIEMFGGLERPKCVAAGARLLHDLLLSKGDRFLTFGVHEMRATTM
jgi:hypothetical protein